MSKLQAVLDKDPNKDRTSNQQRTQDTNIDVPRFVSWLEYAIAIALACIVAFGLYLGCLAWVHKSTVSLADNKALISACRSYSSIAPHVPAQPSRPTLPPSLYNTLEKLVGTKIATFIQTAVPLIIIVGVVIALVKGIGFVLSFSKILIYASIDPRINTVISLAFTIGVLYCLFRMQQERYMIQELSGADFEDNQWGFGQILTVFIWVPLSLNLLRWAAMLLLHKMSRWLPYPHERTNSVQSQASLIHLILRIHRICSMICLGQDTKPRLRQPEHRSLKYYHRNQTLRCLLYQQHQRGHIAGSLPATRPRGVE